jgi:hypothetical protein
VHRLGQRTTLDDEVSNLRTATGWTEYQAATNGLCPQYSDKIG